jgi:hypothetical protein
MVAAELCAIHLIASARGALRGRNSLQWSNCIPGQDGQMVQRDACASRLQEPAKPEPLWCHELIEHGWNNCQRNFTVD